VNSVFNNQIEHQTKAQTHITFEETEISKKYSGQPPLIESFEYKKLQLIPQSGYNIPDLLKTADKAAYSSGACVQTATFNHKPIDRNDSYTWTNGISFATGSNPGTGDCQIPEGAIIKSCIVTVRSPSITEPVHSFTHGQVRVNVSGTTIGATNRFSVIGSGVNINFNALCGTEVDGFGIDVILSGTSSCGTTHSHRMAITVDVILIWEVVNVYYQSEVSQQNSYLGDCLVHLDADSTEKHVFTDNGTHLTGGFYTNDINSVYRTFCPSDSGKCIEATIAYMDIEPSYDYLYISNGPAQNSPNLWVGSRTLTNPQTLAGSWSNPFTSTTDNGCLTFRFSTDNSYTYGGFIFIWKVLTAAKQNHKPMLTVQLQFQSAQTPLLPVPARVPGMNQHVKAAFCRKVLQHGIILNLHKAENLE